MIHHLLSVVLAGMVTGLQGWPRLVNRYFGVDTWRNLSIADEIRAARRLPDESISNQLIKGPFDYPPIFFVLLALLPRGWVERWQGLLGPAIEGCHSLIAYWVVAVATGDTAIALVAQAVFLVTPVTALENATMNARGFGALVFTLSAVTTAIAMIQPAWWTFAVAALATLTVLFTHKMASQVVYLAYPLMSLALGNPMFVAVMAAAIAIALVLFRRRYLMIVRGQLAVLRWFRAVRDVRYAHQITGRVRDHGAARDVIVRVKHAIARFPLFAVVASNPLAFVAIGWAIVAGAAAVSADPARAGLMTLAVTGLAILLVLAIATASIAPLQFLGEGTKYLVYAQLPIGIVLGVLVRTELSTATRPWGTAVAALTALGCIAQIVYLQRHVVLKDQLRSLRPALQPIVERLRMEPGVHVAVFPFPSADIVAYFSGCRTLRTDSAFAYWHDADYRDLDPVFRRPLTSILSKYAIKYILISTDYVAPDQLGLPSVDVALHSGTWMLLRSPVWDGGDRPVVRQTVHWEHIGAGAPLTAGDGSRHT